MNSKCPQHRAGSLAGFVSAWRLARLRNATPVVFLALSFLLAVTAARPAPAREEPPLRPPAVPLVLHDPYFSIWSAADRLTDVDTMHWTGRRHALRSLIRIDGRAWRLLGAEPADVPAFPQTGVRVLPTRTIYGFREGGVEVTLTFLTPALPSALEVLARPATYLTWEVRCTDGKPRDVQVHVSASSEIAVDDPSQSVAWRKIDVPGLEVLRVGSVEQPVLAKRGDDLRIDWGYLYLAAPSEPKCGAGVALDAEILAAFRTHGALPAETLRVDPRAPLPVKDGFPALALAFDLGRVGTETATRRAILAYDDEQSILYFARRLRPYWRRHGADAARMLAEAEREYPALERACIAFDAALLADLERAGGSKYARLCSLAYRQTLAGNKIAADPNGMPLVFPKENFSNGCIATVDVLFPQAPFFLALSPALTKGMLVPILDYAASRRWKHAYAPHDLGTYPHATGQVYGGGEVSDENQMPVEESGNMLIMLAALAKIEGDASFAMEYRPLLARWADYCVKEGLDPANQLCSADMFGHLPRCANLALKAVIAIGAYGSLAKQAGLEEEGARYLAIARDYAVKWRALAGGEGRTRLAYHLPETWGMKHNLIWDRILGLDLFPVEIGDAEIAWYLKVQKPFGLPVDNRTDTSLIDWALWSIAVAREDRDFQALLAPLYRYAHETPTRVPLSDWFVTTDGTRKGFQARPVVGGLFIRLLADPTLARRGSGLATKVAGDWAPLRLPTPSREILPTAESSPIAWRYTLETPREGWERPVFDDAAWREGQAGFGTPSTPGAVVRTEWTGKEIWLRREFVWPEGPVENPRFRVHYDEDPDIYVNGILAASPRGWTTAYAEIPIAGEAKAALRPGRNVIAVHARQTYGGQSIDLGIVADGEALPLRRLIDTPLRDPSICRGPDGTWYLTGTCEPFWASNEGIQVWKSPDLIRWEPLGFVWRYGESPWHKPYLEAKKPLWAPEMHYLEGTFWLTYSLPGWDGTGATSGSGLLRSTSGKAEGPWVDVQPNARLGDEIDASLFRDDDGAIYFVWHCGKIARMKPDMSGLDEPYRWLRTTTTDPNPEHHSGLCPGIFGRDSFDHVGYEGMFLFKEKGRYYLTCGENYEGRYSCAASSAPSLRGPWSPRYEAIPHAGHNMFYKDDEGHWWSTFFGSDPGAPFVERAAVLPVEFDIRGRIGPKGR